MLYHSAGRTNIKRAVAVILAALILSLIWDHKPAYAAELPPVDISARSALLIDIGSEEILYQRNIRDKAYPASLTKIMTALLALEYAESAEGGLDQKVTASQTAVEGFEPDVSTLGIQVGEVISLRDLLYCILVSSANEACNVIAEHVAGSIPDFVAKMNARALELGCLGTHFTNTHGLHDDNHFTTAYDCYLITMQALNYPEFKNICDTRNPISITSVGPDGQTPITHMLQVTNELIATRASNQYLYHQASGIKTGSTSMAGYCLVSSAEANGLSLLSVVMGADKEEETGLILSFVETKRLFEWGFENFTVMTLLNTTDQIEKVKVFEGKNTDEVVLVPSDKLEALVPKTLEITTDVSRQIRLFDEGGIYAPVERGQVLGEITLSFGNRVFDTIPLVASVSVKRDETEHFWTMTKNFVSQDWVLYTLAGLAVAVLLYISIAVIHNRRRRKRDSRQRNNYRGRRKGWRRRY